MNFMHFTCFSFVIAVIIVGGCSRKADSETSFSADSTLIRDGQTAFVQHCSACHNFRQDGIGPQLNPLPKTVSHDWLISFIRDPKAVIESGDERAVALFEKYDIYMPPFGHLTENELNGIVAYILNQQSANAVMVKADDPNALKDPIPQKIPLSDIVIELEEIIRMPESTESVPHTRICKLDYRPDNGELFIVDLQGKLYRIKKGKHEVYLDLPSRRPDFIDKPGRATGFGSFAFHPDFSRNGLLYTSHTEPPSRQKADFHYHDSIKATVQWVITEWQTKKPDQFPFAESTSRELFRANMVTGIHGMQELAFNPLARPGSDDYGLLYIGIGDGGSAEAGFPFLNRSKEKIWGAVLRIDPRGSNSANGKYGIPPTNPFVNIPGALGEIYAHGFRNPHRISWSQKGDMLVSNIGQHQIEALTLVYPGRDYGWPIREGTFVINPYGKMSNIYPLPPDDSLYHITYPAAQYDHDEGKAITGGYEYTGSNLPALKGKYIFGDLNNGRLFYINMSDLTGKTPAPIYEWRPSVKRKIVTLAEQCGETWVHLRMGRDRDGELYVFTKPDGRVYKLKSMATGL